MRVLILSAHPDDETLGMGGTILKHLEKNDEVYWFLATSCHAPQYSDEIIRYQKGIVEELNKDYGFNDFFWAKLPTTKLDEGGASHVIDQLQPYLEKVNPEIIYSVGEHDVHTDHQLLFNSLLTAVKSFNRKHSIHRILTYEIISSTDIYPDARNNIFVPNVYSDIGKHIDRKIEIFSKIKAEVHEYPLPRSLESVRALARYRGATIGTDYAEAFKLVFERW